MDVTFLVGIKTVDKDNIFTMQKGRKIIFTETKIIDKNDIVINCRKVER